LKDFDDFIVPALRNKPNTFGDTFCLSYLNQMPLTVIRLISGDGNISDILCQTDLGADGSAFFEKHMNKINHSQGGTVPIVSSTGEASHVEIYGFSLAIEVLCPRSGDKYSCIVPINKGPFVTLRQDKDARINNGGMRWIFGNLGRNILVQNNIGLIFNENLFLTRELSDAERKTCREGPYPSLTGISLRPE
jgi:hypothetical protein